MAINTTAALIDALRVHGVLSPAQLNEIPPHPGASDRCPRPGPRINPARLAHPLPGQPIAPGPWCRTGAGGIPVGGTAGRRRHGPGLQGPPPAHGPHGGGQGHPQGAPGQPDAVERFKREIRLTAKLDHPHLIRAYDASQAGEAHFLVMEYAEGTDLQRLIQKSGPLPVAQACEYIRQAALGLQFAAEHGLVHRDIKPSNMQVTAQGKVIKLLDMGLARMQEPDGAVPVTELTQNRVILGTADYMAPEQIADLRRVDGRADIYSLGCSLYFLLTGQPPFPEARGRKNW